jgi:hypothetical protein
MTRRADPHNALTRALAELFSERGLTADLVTGETTPWASATFVGARHVIGYACRDSVAALAREIGEVEFSLPDHLVASIEIDAFEGGFVVEALTIEDR